jgi:LacI family transcriptional regulator
VPNDFHVELASPDFDRLAPYDSTLVKDLTDQLMEHAQYEAMNILLQASPRVTAVFIASDVVAMGAIRAIKEAGLHIPKDIAVVGFDDIPLAEFYDPPLTTIRLPAFGLGWAGGERLIRIIQGEGLNDASLLLESTLITRQSSS